MADASCRRPLNLFSPGGPLLWRRFRGNATFACASCLCLHPQKLLWGAQGNFFGALGAIFMVRTLIFSFWATFWDCLGHLGVPGWSGAGFIRIWGTCGVHFERQFPSFSLKKWYRVGCSWNFCYTSSGEAFWLLLHESSDPRGRKIYSKLCEDCSKWRFHEN